MLELKNKKGQIGETLTWVVATVIIIFVLAISIFISSFNSDKFKRVQESSYQTTDVLASKSLFSYLLTMDSEGKIVHSQLKEEENLNDFNGELGKKIFEGSYDEEYEDLWLGIILNRPTLLFLLNDYFGSRPDEAAGGGVIGERALIPHVTEGIYLEENKSVELVLIEK